MESKQRLVIFRVYLQKFLGHALSIAVFRVARACPCSLRPSPWCIGWPDVFDQSMLSARRGSRSLDIRSSQLRFKTLAKASGTQVRQCHSLLVFLSQLCFMCQQHPFRIFGLMQTRVCDSVISTFILCIHICTIFKKNLHDLESI